MPSIGPDVNHISAFQNHLQTKLDLHISVRLNLKETFQCGIPCNSADWTGCAAHCATLPQGQCLCPRSTEDECKTVNGCSWLKGICIHEFEKIYNAQIKKLSIPGTYTITIFRHVTVLFIHTVYSEYLLFA